MSLYTLAANRVARDLSSRTARDDTGQPVKAAIRANDTEATNAVGDLAAYLPDETVTLYIAFIAALPALTNRVAWLDAEFVYVLFALLTPVLFVVIYGGKRRAAGLSRWPPMREWPWWPMVAAIIAFLAWGIVVPNGPYLADDGGRVISGLIAVVASALLNVVGRLFTPRAT